jgi:hypothetical protein
VAVLPVPVPVPVLAVVVLAVVVLAVVVLAGPVCAPGGSRLVGGVVVSLPSRSAR